MAGDEGTGTPNSHKRLSVLTLAPEHQEHLSQARVLREKSFELKEPEIELIIVRFPEIGAES